MKKVVSLVVAVLMLNGCGSILGSKKVSMEHANYRELISSEFSDDLAIVVSSYSGSLSGLSAAKANAPRDSLSIYCQRDGGNLEQVLIDGSVSYKHREVLNLSGIFACKTASNTNLWMVNIDARPARGYFDTKGYVFRVKEYSIDKYESNLAQQKRKAEAAELKAKREAKAAELKAKREAEAAALEKKAHLARFQNMVSLAKIKGEKVCSWSNKYGFVEELSGNKIKILVKGAARGVVDGFFFLEEGHKFRTSPMNEYIWDDSRKWGVCWFSQ